MVDISVNYMGLKLQTPFIAASSGYTADLEKIVALANSGIGAIVLKSLFEEQINREAQYLAEQSAEYPENADFLQRYVTDHSVAKYIELISEAKKAVRVPIIASISCFSKGNWTSFAKEIEKAGADALEVNIYSLPLSIAKTSESIEREYYDVISALTASVRIPVSVKIGETFTNLPEFVNSAHICGAKGVVLFNRFYRPDISLKTLELVAANPFSSEGEYTRELRWIAIISSIVRGLDISASTGVHESSDAIKLLLAGAKTVQLCSIMYQQKHFVVNRFVDELKTFMNEKGFERLSDFCGKLNYSNISHPEKFERMQFLKTGEKYSK